MAHLGVVCEGNLNLDKPIGPAALPPKDRQTVRFLVYFLCNVCTFVDVRI